MESRELQEFENDLIELTDEDLVDRYNDDLATDAWKDAPTGYSEVMLRAFQGRNLDISAITDGETLLYNVRVMLDDGVLRPERDVTDRI